MPKPLHTFMFHHISCFRIFFRRDRFSEGHLFIALCRHTYLPRLHLFGHLFHVSTGKPWDLADKSFRSILKTEQFSSIREFRTIQSTRMPHHMIFTLQYPDFVDSVSISTATVNIHT